MNEEPIKKVMTSPRRRAVLEQLIAKGPMTHDQIESSVGGSVSKQDVFDLRRRNLIAICGKAPSVGGRSAPNIYQITQDGIERLWLKPIGKVDRRPRVTERRVGAISERKPRVVIKAARPKPAPEPKPPKVPRPRPPKIEKVALPVTITVPENAKITVYEPKFTVTPYTPPKNFMECVR